MTARTKVNGRLVEWFNPGIQLQYGTRSMRYRMRVTTEAHNYFSSMAVSERRNVTIDLSWIYEDQGRSVKQSERWSKLRLLEAIAATDPRHMMWNLADCRYELELQKATYDFNITRRSGQSTTIPTAKGAAIDYQTTPRFRYLPHTLRDVTKNDFPRPQDSIYDYPESRPWTCLEMVEKVLADHGAEYRIESRDNGYVRDNLKYRVHPVPAILNELLSLARANMWVDLNGVIVVSSIDLRDPTVDSHGKRLIPLLGAPSEGGKGQWPIEQNLKAAQPELYRYHFISEYELLFTHEEESRSSGTQTRVASQSWKIQSSINRFSLIPVLQLPDTITFEGQEYTAGTYVPQELALAAWNAEGDYPRMPMSITGLKDNYFAGKYEMQFTYTSNAINKKWLARLNAFRAAFRTIYQIHPAWRDRIDTWAPVLATVTNPLTFDRQRSQAIMDYCVQPSMFTAGMLQNDPGASQAANNIVVWKPTYAATVDRAPAEIGIIDKDVGIFRVNWYADKEGHDARYYPGQVDDIPDYELSADYFHWEFARLADGFKFGIVLTCTLATPNSTDRHYTIYKKADDSSVHGNGITQDVLVPTETAKFKWSDDVGAAIVGNNIKITGAMMDDTSKGVIHTIVELEHDNAQYSWQSLVTGHFDVHGWDRSLYRPIGPVRSVSFKFNASSAPRTRINCTDETPPPNYYEDLPPELRERLYQVLQIKDTA